jgi:hypothetical protein
VVTEEQRLEAGVLGGAGHLPGVDAFVAGDHADPKVHA